MFDIEKLVKDVTTRLNDDSKARYDNQKSVVNDYCKENNLQEVERIIVKTSYEEIEIEGKKSTTKVTRHFCAKEDIITALQYAYPDMIDSNIYFFPHSEAYFITDKNYLFNLHHKPRPLRVDELNKIQSLKDELNEVAEELEERRQTCLQLKALYTFNPNEEQLAFRNTNEAVIAGIMYDYDSGLLYCNKWQADKEEYKKQKEEVGKKIREIYCKSWNEPIYSVHPMKDDKQVRIYFSNSDISRFRELGYSIINQKRDGKLTKWNKDTLEYEQIDNEFTSHSIKMARKAFIGCCKFDMLVQKGYYLNEQGERLLIEKSGVKEEVTIIDWNGTSHSFGSKSEAARHFKVSNAFITQTVKNGGIITEQPRDHKKDFTLISPSNEHLYFKSVSDAALFFKCGKSTLSEKMKGKSNGDTVKIKKQSFILA